MSIVYKPVEDTVGDGGITDLRVPGGDRQLTGQQGGMHLITRITDLQKITALCLGQRGHRPIVDDQQVEPAEPVEQFAVATVGPCHSQVAKQFRGFEE